MSRQPGRWICVATGIDYLLALGENDKDPIAELWLEPPTGGRWHWLMLHGLHRKCVGGSESSKIDAQRAVRLAQKVMQ